MKEYSLVEKLDSIDKKDSEIDFIKRKIKIQSFFYSALDKYNKTHAASTPYESKELLIDALSALDLARNLANDLEKIHQPLDFLRVMDEDFSNYKEDLDNLLYACKSLKDIDNDVYDLKNSSKTMFPFIRYGRVRLIKQNLRKIKKLGVNIKKYEDTLKSIIQM